MTANTPTSAPAEKPLKHLTTRHMERAFGVTTMTLYLWRKGTATLKPLPTVDLGGRKVAYAVKAVERWAKANGVPVLVDDLATLLADDGLKPRKDGRRARIVKASAAKHRQPAASKAKPAKPSKREQAKSEH